MAVWVVVLFLFVALAAAAGGEAALVEHTFVVSEMKLHHLCKDTLVPVVNGQLPGPAIEVTEGDSVVVHVINKLPHAVTIHWHGVKQQMNCWADGAAMITQCPIQPNNNFTYRFNITAQEGTLWWHAHIGCLRATVHGALVIRPRLGPDSYPFPKPDEEIPILIGEWWDIDPIQLEKIIARSEFNDHARSTTLNGKLGDLNNCSGVIEDTYNLNVEYGKTYLLRIVNAGLHSEYYFKIAGHEGTQWRDGGLWQWPPHPARARLPAGASFGCLTCAALFWSQFSPRFYTGIVVCLPPQGFPEDLGSRRLKS